MYSDSRKAQRDTHAHQRANLLFSKPLVDRQERAQIDRTESDLLARERVRAGIIGFVPAPAKAGS